LANWTGVTGLIVQQQEVYAGTYAARETSTGAATWAYRLLGLTQNELYYRLRFKIVSLGSNVYLLKFRTSSDDSLLGLYVSSQGRLAYRNDVTGVSTTSLTDVAAGVWHDVQVRVRINGANSQTEVWLDGARVDALSETESLGTTPIGRIQLGDNSTGRIYDVVLDNAAANTTFIDMTPPIVALAEPVANAAVRDSVTFAAEALDNIAMDRVEFLVNGIIVGIDYTSPYDMIWNSTTMGDGPATITARAVDNTFNPAVSTSRIVMVDNTPPDTTIDSGPSGTVSATTATFTFSSSETGATIACVLDDVEVELCASPFTYDNLAAGSHTFRVVSTDAAGNIDPTPAVRTWTVASATLTPTATSTPTATPTATPTSMPSPTPFVILLPFITVDDAQVSTDGPNTNSGALSKPKKDIIYE
jgi:hypothetical protein